jgi:Protein of unknown function (DUF3309)
VPHGMGPVVARRVISWRCNNSAAFGAARTFSKARSQNRIYEYAPLITGNRDHPDEAPVPLLSVPPSKPPINKLVCRTLFALRRCVLMEAADGNHPAHHLDLLVIGALPAWPYSSRWGYYPSGGLGLVLILVLTDRL